MAVGECRPRSRCCRWADIKITQTAAQISDSSVRSSSNDRDYDAKIVRDPGVLEVTPGFAVVQHRFILVLNRSSQAIRCVAAFVDSPPPLELDVIRDTTRKSRGVAAEPQEAASHETDP